MNIESEPVSADAADESVEVTSSAKEAMDAGFELAIYGLDGAEIINEETDKLTAMFRQEEISGFDVHTAAALKQAEGKYQQA